MAEIMITVSNLSKTYTLGANSGYRTLAETVSDIFNPSRWKRQPRGEEFHALNDVSFTVKQGEVVGLIGRNGAGKSTLLKILSQITYPTSGSVKLHGRVASLLEVGTGFHPELSGRENIFLNGAILGMTRHEIRSKFKEIVEFAEIEQFIDTPVKRYSSGMYVRLAFAVAAHLEPEILLVDEVLAVGDVEFQKKCLGKVNEVTQKHGRTVIFVSHNLSIIQKLCQRALLLQKGSVILDATADQAIQAYLKEFANASPEIDLSQRVDRQGNGDMRITKVYFQNDKAEPVSVFYSGQNARILFNYAAKPGVTLKNVTFSSAISNQLGEIILNLYNLTTGNQLHNLSQDGQIVLNIPNLPLMPGTYYFNIFATANKEIVDWVIDAGSFEVDFGDFFGTGQLPPEGQGNFLLKHNWSSQ